METQLLKELVHYKSHAWALNTQKAYATHRRTYLKFCLLLRRNPAPADEKLVCLYAAWLARKLSFKSIKLYLHIVTLIHRERGLLSPCIGSFQLSQTLRGIRRIKGDVVHPKAPITPDLLLHLRARLDFASQKHRAVWAAGLMMFVGLLRRSNVMPPSTQGFTPDRHLCVKDIIPNSQGYCVNIRWSKTVQFRQAAVTIFLPRRKGHPLCPMRAVFLALKGAPQEGNAPALGYHINGVFHPLTPPVFIEELRKALQGANLDPADYAGHSFRRGGATWLHQCGASSQSIKLMGQWASDCYQRYVSPGESERRELASVTINSLP